MSEKKVYIGTLYVGENEIDECRQSVQNQTFKNITHEIFSYLPNKEAHDTLYSKFMQLQDEYDYFIKLDADMVLKRNTMVEELVRIFENNKNLDHAVFTVHDWYSNSDIMGMHMFNNKVSWTISKEALFVDPDPKRKGEKLNCWGGVAPVAEHSPNPSIEEAYMFGYHRGLKVVQRGRWIKNPTQSKFQLNLLHKTWNNLVKDHDVRRLAAIKGAEKAFTVKHLYLNSKHNNIFKYEISNIENINVSSVVENCKKNWNTLKVKKIKYITIPKIYTFPFRAFTKVIKLLNNKCNIKKNSKV